MTVIVEILVKLWDAATMFAAALGYQERMIALLLAYLLVVVAVTAFRSTVKREREIVFVALPSADKPVDERPSPA